MEKPKKSCCTGNAKVKVETVASKIDVVKYKIDENNFKLRTDLGVNRITFDNGLYLSQEECDDDVAIGFLLANQSRISMFEKYPENWKELITKSETENE